MQSAVKATRREWIALSVLALPALVYLTDVTALEIALPQISASLQPSSAQFLWLADIYGFVLAAFLITMGTLGDRIGRKKLLLLGAAGFVLVSCAASVSNSIEVLILLRGLLGIAAATLAPSTMGLIRNMFHDDAERQFAIGIWIAAISSGGVLGPLLGGLVLRFFSWHFVFLIPVPPMLLVLILGPRLLQEYRDRHASRLDLTSAAMSLAALLPAIQGLKLIAADGFGVWPLAMLAAGVAAGTALLRRQRKLAHPLMDPALFRQPKFMPAVMAYGLSCFALFGLFVLITQYLQLVLGLSPWEAGLATAPSAVASAAGSLGAPGLVNWFAPRRVLMGGLVTAIAGIVMLEISVGRFGLAGMVAGTVVFSLGVAMAFTPAYEMIVTCAPPERSGAAAAIAETASELSGSTGIALLGSLGTAVYRHVLLRALPAGLSAVMAERAAATIGSASAISAGLPSAVGEPLLASARAAFSAALQFALAAAGVAIAAACVVVIRAGRESAKYSRSAP
jgi:DHA2 family multidrug resistance protein-like MFS transporter